MFKIMIKVREENETKSALWSVYQEENDNGDIVDVELDSITDIEEKVKEIITVKKVPATNVLVYNPNAISITVDVAETV